MKKDYEWLFKLLFEAGSETGGGDPPPANTDPPPSEQEDPEVDLDYTKFDLKLDEKMDPTNLTSKAFSEKAKELGISVTAARDLFSTINPSLNTSQEEYNKQAEQRSEAALKERWGDSFEKNNNALKRGFLKITEGDKTLNEELSNSNVIHDPLVAELFSRVGMLFKEENGGMDETNTFDEKDPYGFGREDRKNGR